MPPPRPPREAWSRSMILSSILTMMTMSFTASVRSAPRSTEAAGASLLFTSEDPIVVQARRLIEQGELSRAESLLKQPGGDAAARAQGVEILARIHADFGLSADGLLEKLRK